MGTNENYQTLSFWHKIQQNGPAELVNAPLPLIQRCAPLDAHLQAMNSREMISDVLWSLKNPTDKWMQKYCWILGIVLTPTNCTMLRSIHEHFATMKHLETLNVQHEHWATLHVPHWSLEAKRRGRAWHGGKHRLRWDAFIVIQTLQLRIRHPNQESVTFPHHGKPSRRNPQVNNSYRSFSLFSFAAIPVHYGHDLKSRHIQPHICIQ